MKNSPSLQVNQLSRVLLGFLFIILSVDADNNAQLLSKTCGNDYVCGRY
jgi:hypothetical protein